MKRALSLGIVLLLCILPATAEDLVVTRGWLLEHATGVTVELWSDEDTWQNDPQLANYGHSYRRLRVLDAAGAVMIEEVLPVDRAPDFAYRLSFDAGDAPLVIIEGAFLFYLLDLTNPTAPVLSGAVRPLSPDEIIGVDGRSGQYVDLWVSDDGQELGGAVIHGGCFRFDISVPSAPERVFFREDWSIEGMGPYPQCKPGGD